ncbi:glutamine synthetase, partial [Pseudomonas syringae pv. tagetis]
DRQQPQQHQSPPISQQLHVELQVTEQLIFNSTYHPAIERLKTIQLAKQLYGHEFIECFKASNTMELNSFLDEKTPRQRRVQAAKV